MTSSMFKQVENHDSYFRCFSEDFLELTNDKKKLVLDSISNRFKWKWRERNNKGINQINNNYGRFIATGNPNDDATYYVIDYNKLRNDMPTTVKNLDFGSVNTIVPTSLREYNSTTLHGTVPTTDEEWLEVNDVFIINNASHQVYYVAGVEYKGIVYHKLADD